jgi:D-proline reductase (dithiol) PrdB
VPVLAELNQVQRNRILMRPVPISAGTPWTVPRRPLAQSTLALVTTSGLHHRGDAPFLKYDQTHRVIDADVAEADLLQSQSSIGFDRSLRMRDVNVVFPADRLRELVAEGAVGALTPHFYSLVGAQEDSEKTAETVGGRIGPLLLEQGAEAVLITPTCPVCTHTSGVLARVLEEQGLATVAISLVREYTEKVKPPRAVFVPFPFGAPCGLPGERAQQLSVVRTALATFTAPRGPVLVDFASAGNGGYSPGPVQASGTPRSDRTELDAAAETSMMRRYHEQWVAEHGKTAVGLTRIPVVRFRGIIRFLEAFAEGDADMRERPDDVPLPDFVRYCCDDLKALYLEGRLVMNPAESADDAARWLWGETALGALLVGLKTRMEASDDPAVRGAAFGIAR